MKRKFILTPLLELLFVATLFSFGFTACTTHSNNDEGAVNGLNLIKLDNLEDAEEFLMWTEDRIPMVSAHRGGVYYDGFAENTIEMFEFVVSNVPAIIEFDVRRSKDGALVVMHDSSTGRTTTVDKEIEDMNLDEIKELTLIDYEGNEVAGSVPTLTEVLKWGRGKTLFTVDVKAVRDLDESAETIIRENAESYAVLITYSLNVAQQVHEKFPSLLLSVTIRNEEELERFLNTGINPEKVVAFTGTSARDKSFNDKLHEMGIYTILGTLDNIDNSAKVRGGKVYRDLIQSGSDILSTDYPVEAYGAFKDLIPNGSSKERFFAKDI